MEKKAIVSMFEIAPESTERGHVQDEWKRMWFGWVLEKTPVTKEHRDAMVLLGFIPAVHMFWNICLSICVTYMYLHTLDRVHTPDSLEDRKILNTTL
jgi:hypothetical protein